MGSFKLYATVAGCLAAVSSISAVRAADLLPPPPPAPMEPYVSDIGGGWYLRGDVGVSHYDGGKLANASSPGISYYDRDFGSGAFAGVGIGYQFNSWFRADVTGEYRFSTGFSWRDQGGGLSVTTPFYNPGRGAYDIYTANGTSYERTASNYYAAVVLANGYFDLGTWYGFTPFVGGGIGYAYHYLTGGDTTTVNAYGNYTGPAGPISGGPPAGISGGTIRNANKGDLAWALHAGVAYDVTPNVKLEVAYRYLNMGDLKTGAINCFCNQTYSGTRIRDLEAHDIKIGMRWAFGGPAVAAYEPAPSPLIRKY